MHAIVVGRKGTGKTTLAATGRRPILYHMFDPGGEKSIRHLLDDPSARVYADTRFSEEDPWHPTAAEAWEKEFNRLYDMNFFDKIGTYVLDSGTTWSDYIMNAVLYKRHKAGQKPEWPEYYAQQLSMRDYLTKILSLPCDVIMPGHIDTEKDEISGSLYRDILLTGKLKVKIPLLFDEVYMTRVTETKDGRDYEIVTQPSERFTACTRLGANGRFDAVEKADIKNLLRKAGLPCEDLPA
jgi:hypothetical protein